MDLKTTVQIGYKLLKGDIKSALQTIDPSNYFGGGWNGNAGNEQYLFGEGAVEKKKFVWLDASSGITAYQRCPQVAAIINRKSQAYVNGKTYILNSAGKAKDKESTSLQANKIRSLLKKPNAIQSGKQFEAQAYAMQQLHGYAIVLMNKPFGYTGNEDASSMWIIPNWLCEVFETTALPWEAVDGKIITAIYFTYGGKRVQLPLEDIVILKDLTPALTSVVLPASRIIPISEPINNIIGAYESRGTLINNRGPIGFITQENNPMGNIPLTEAEEWKLQKQFRKYGLRRNQVSMILATAAAFRFEKVGFNVAELGLHEEVKNSGIDVCNGLSYPPFLLGLSDTTYNNQAEASRGLYMETIIPEAESISEQWCDIFNMSEYGIYLTKDYSHVSALQEDRRNAATALKTQNEALEKAFKNNVITLNRWLVIIDEDPRTDGFGEMYYYQLLALGWKFGDTSVTGGDTKPTGGTDNGNQQTGQ